jgi:hypothetical protein
MRPNHILLKRDSSHWKKTNTGFESKKKVFQSNGPQKQAGVALFISDKVDFRLKSSRRDNEGHFILMRGTIHQEVVSVLTIYAPNRGHHLH